MRDHADKGFRQPDHDRSRSSQAVALTQPRHIGRIDLRIGVAEEVRAVGAHQVERAAPVGVPEVSAVPAAEELGIVVGKAAGALMSVHAAGDHRLSAIAQRSIFAGHRQLGQRPRLSSAA